MINLRNVVLAVSAVISSMLWFEFNKNIFGNVRKKRFGILYILVSSVVTFSLHFFVNAGAARIIINGLANYLLVLAVFYGLAFVKLFITTLLVVVTQIGDIFTWSMILLIFPDYLSEDIVSPNMIFLLGVTISHLYLMGVVLIFKRFPTQRHGILTKRQSLLLTGMPLLSYAVIALMLRYFQERQSNEFYVYLIPSIFFIGLLIFIVLFFRYMLSSQENARISAVLNSQIESFASQYDALDASLQLLRERSHDWKNHMLALRGLAETDDTDGIRRYIDSAYKWDEPEISVYTGNPAVDIIFRVLKAKAGRAGIGVSITINLEREIVAGTADICVLISNAVDNAFEACERITDGERHIDIEIKTNKTYLFFTIINTIREQPRTQNGRFITSKPDGELHGIGLQSITRIAEKHSGHVTVTTEDNKFALRCMLKNASE